MKISEWNEGLCNIDTDLVEKYVKQKDELRKKKNPRRLLLRIAALAACIAVIVSAIIVVPMFREDDKGGITVPDTTDPSIVKPHPQQFIPRYYGSEDSKGGSLTGARLEDPPGLSVTAELVEVLPDTYTFFDNWKQCELRLLRMKTVKLLKGQEMTEEFYYMVPVRYMTDFTLFDRFVIMNMAQFSYEYSVMFNKSQSKPEQIKLVLFSHAYVIETSYGKLLCSNIMAFDARGNFDDRLWNSNEVWREATNRSAGVDNITQAETNAHDITGNDRRVQLLECISGEPANVISQIQSFENGVFVPTSSTKYTRRQDYVNFNARRYINGFATNEMLHVGSKAYSGGTEDNYYFTKAHFSEEDLKAIPDLSTAIESVATAFDNGEVIPPHIKNYQTMEFKSYGIFGWYAKTTDGVVGVVRVTWSYSCPHKYCYDDAYYIVEYGSDEYKFIDRDALLERLGENEATYIYSGRYDEEGKMDWRILLA